MFPLGETFHALGLGASAGIILCTDLRFIHAVLVLDLRLLGFGMRLQPVSRLAQQVRPVATVGIAVMMLTGVPLFCSEALKTYGNPAFWSKLARRRPGRTRDRVYLVPWFPRW